jgi:hypothetical protein
MNAIPMFGSPVLADQLSNENIEGLLYVDRLIILRVVGSNVRLMDY